MRSVGGLLIILVLLAVACTPGAIEDPAGYELAEAAGTGAVGPPTPAEPDDDGNVTLAYDPELLEFGEWAVVVTVWDEDLGLWLDLPSQVDPDTDTVSAELSGDALALAAPTGPTATVGSTRERLVRWAERASVTVGRVLGTRTFPPSCSDTSPDWVDQPIDNADDDNGVLLVCGQKAAGGGYEVRLTSNRAYPMLLTSTVPPRSVEVTGLPDGLLQLAASTPTVQEQRDLGSVVYVTGHGAVRYVFDERDDVNRVELVSTIDAHVFALDLVWGLVSALDLVTAPAVELASCGYTQLSGLVDANETDFDVQAVASQAVDALVDCAEQIAQLAGTVTTERLRDLLRIIDLSTMTATAADAFTDIATARGTAWFTTRTSAEHLSPTTPPEEPVATDVVQILAGLTEEWKHLNNICRGEPGRDEECARRDQTAVSLMREGVEGTLEAWRQGNAEALELLADRTNSMVDTIVENSEPTNVDCDLPSIETLSEWDGTATCWVTVMPSGFDNFLTWRFEPYNRDGGVPSVRLMTAAPDVG